MNSMMVYVQWAYDKQGDKFEKMSCRIAKLEKNRSFVAALLMHKWFKQ
jgi:hypothetical protein